MTLKKIKQTINFKIKPEELYDIIMNSKKHSLFTDSKAKISNKINGKFSVYDGYIEGKNLELIKNKKIVQSWRTTEFNSNKDSIVTFNFIKTKNGCKLVFLHENVPSELVNDLKQGWNDFYWNPIKEMFEK